MDQASQGSVYLSPVISISQPPDISLSPQNDASPEITPKSPYIVAESVIRGLCVADALSLPAALRKPVDPLNVFTSLKEIGPKVG